MYLTVRNTTLPPVNATVRGVSPYSVNYTASITSSTMLLSNGTRQPLLGAASASVPTRAWRMLFLPVILNAGPSRPSGGAVVANPWLNATVTAAPKLTNGSTGPATLFYGYWSWTNGSYVIPYMLPTAGNWSMSMRLGYQDTTSPQVGSLLDGLHRTCSYS